MAFHSLHDVLVDLLKDLLHAEKQLVRALPKMAKAATDETLKDAFLQHAEVTEGQVERLEQVFESIGVTARSKTCPGMKGIIEEGEEVISHKKDAEPAVMDAALIIAGQKAEHYEMASYGSARTLAEVLGCGEAASLLQESLDEESEANEKLNEIAGQINEVAMEFGDEEGGEEQERFVGKRQRMNGSRGRMAAYGGRIR